MTQPTDYDILSWLEANIDKIQISRHYDWSKCKNNRPVFQYKLRTGLAGQSIYSEKEYMSLREMAIDALKQ